MTDDLARDQGALLVQTVDFRPGRAGDGNRWFDHDHVPTVLMADGVLAATRFQRLDLELEVDRSNVWSTPGGTPPAPGAAYLHSFALASAEVLAAPSYRALNAASHTGRWARRQHAADSPGGVDPVRQGRETVWRPRPSPWAEFTTLRPRTPRVLLVLLRQVSGEASDAVSAFLDEEQVPELLALPGFLGCERFEVIAHPGEPGLTQPGDLPSANRLDILDLVAPEVATSAELRDYLNAPSPTALRLGLEVAPVSCDVYLERPSPWRVRIA